MASCSRFPCPSRRWLPVAFASVLLAALAAREPAAQPAPGPEGRDTRRPLQYDQTDWWGEVHRWTGSEATRPRATRPPAAPARTRAAPAEGASTIVTSATSRANIRQEPSLDAPVVRSMPRESSLTVFGEAPGGWYHVGESEPFGWIHRSALRR